MARLRPCRTSTRFTALLLAASPVPLAAQAPPAVGLAAGPMNGYSEMREALVWLQTTGPARVRIEYWDSTAPGTRMTTAEVLTETRTAHTAKLVADRLEPGRVYHYRVLLDGAPVERPWPLRFQSQVLWQFRGDPPPFRIALASCFYANEPAYDRPGPAYGSDFQILGALHRAHPDAMLWLGDNTYLREADWYTRSGILHRYSHTRAREELQPLLGSTHHYATWDDHDYGPNDSDRSFRDKALTREAFQLFWGNATFGLEGQGGITTMFQWSDVDFFLLDNRWFRTPLDRTGGERTVLGHAQREWLIDALATSNASFKIVAMGGQFLNPLPRYEAYARWAEEREWILVRLAEERISGVFFITGDIHHTELNRLERTGGYPLYDLTVSALTARVSKVDPQDGNSLRIPETVVEEHNFATLDFSGPRTDRRMTITVWDAEGRKKWERVVPAGELR